MSAKRGAGKKSSVFSAEERAAMKEYIKEKKEGNEGEAVVLAKIAKMKEPDRVMAKKLHGIIMAAAPGLAPRLWYGMPAYAMDGKTICYFQDANKFKSRYGTLGFSDKARLDDGDFWPIAYAVMKLTPAEEKKITALVKKAVE